MIEISFVNPHIILLGLALVGVVCWLVLDVIRPNRKCPRCGREPK